MYCASHLTAGTRPQFGLRRPGSSRRAIDLTIAIVLGLLLAAPFALLVLLVLVIEGRPVFHVSERMNSTSRAFGLVKLRTMRPAPDRDGVTGGDKAGRMSPLHRLLRRTRIDELPQLWNVIRGDLHLIGPRPPLRIYVEAFPELYARVLHGGVGVTGLASLRFHAHEERLLAACRTAAETDSVYRRRCIPRKARLDMIYQTRRSYWFDLRIIAETAAKPLRGLNARSRGKPDRSARNLALANGQPAPRQALPYPSGFSDCQRQRLCAMSSMPNCAVHPSNAAARDASACIAAISPARRGATATGRSRPTAFENAATMSRTE